jgi:hypothetical protein
VRFLAKALGRRSGPCLYFAAGLCRFSILATRRSKRLVISGQSCSQARRHADRCLPRGFHSWAQVFAEATAHYAGRERKPDSCSTFRCRAGLSRAHGRATYPVLAAKSWHVRVGCRATARRWSVVSTGSPYLTRCERALERPFYTTQ